MILVNEGKQLCVLLPFLVHYGGGFWGVVAVALFDKSHGVLYKWNLRAFRQLGWNLVGAVVISGWAAFWGILVFFTLKALRILRVPRDIELKGEKQ